MSKVIKQTVQFDGVSPEEVYDALMSSKKHADFTGAAANIENKVGGKVSAWDGYIDATNLELQPGRKIVQKWRASEWPEGEWSQATFELKANGDGTELTFEQTGVPDKFVSEIDKGWHESYWEPMKKYFA